MKSRRSTPLKPYTCGFRDHLSTQGYSENRVALYLRHMAHLGRWLDEHDVDLCNFSWSHVKAFLVDRRAAYPYLSRLSLRELTPLLDYLSRIDLLPEPPPSAPATPVDQLLKEFGDYLRKERGLADDTVAHYHHTASRFLAERAARLEAEEVAAFVLAEAERLKSSRRQSVAALRALLRFLHADGRVSASLIAAVPAAAGWHGGELPRALEPDQVERLLASCDRRTAPGLRDFAMFTLPCRLGLRAGEVAKCSVGDVDWRPGEILIHGKGNRQEKLPLPVDVGQALVDYVCRGRPESRCQALFLQKTAPYGPVTRNVVSQAVICHSPTGHRYTGYGGSS